MPKKIYNEEEIVSECLGCSRVINGLGMGDKKYCARHPYPKIHWWGGCKCIDASHINNNPSEDPTEEGKCEDKKRYFFSVKKPPFKNKI
jgi:hypothetical protein